jgi:hypothetical protein
VDNAAKTKITAVKRWAKECAISAQLTALLVVSCPYHVMTHDRRQTKSERKSFDLLGVGLISEVNMRPPEGC